MLTISLITTFSPQFPRSRLGFSDSYWLHWLHLDILNFHFCRLQKSFYPSYREFITSINGKNFFRTLYSYTVLFCEIIHQWELSKPWFIIVISFSIKCLLTLKIFLFLAQADSAYWILIRLKNSRWLSFEFDFLKIQHSRD